MQVLLLIVVEGAGGAIASAAPVVVLASTECTRLLSIESWREPSSVRTAWTRAALPARACACIG